MSVTCLEYQIKVRFDGRDVLLGDTKNDQLGDAEPVIQVPFLTWREILAIVSAHQA